MRATKGGLADLKRLRQKAAAAPEPPASRTAHQPPTTPALQAPAPDADDQRAFRQAVKGAARLHGSQRAILPPVPTAPVAQLRQRRQAAIGAQHAPATPVSDLYTSARQAQDESEFVRAGSGPDLLKGLKRGKWPIGATLDLHGATLDEARERLDQFLQSCLTHHLRCVCVVHGKGHGSKNGTPVLKESVRRWLTQLTYVQAYAECREQDGGSGAVQVLLRQ